MLWQHYDKQTFHYQVCNIVSKNTNLSDITVITKMISEVKLLCLTEANTNFLRSSLIYFVTNIGTALAQATLLSRKASGVFLMSAWPKCGDMVDSNCNQVLVTGYIAIWFWKTILILKTF